LGIVIDDKFKFSQHISHAADKCAKLILSYPNLPKSHGYLHKALTTIYKGAIIPLLLYGAPVSIEVLMYEFNSRKYISVQRLMNLLIAKAYRTTSSEALCVLAGTTPIIMLKKQPSATTSGKDTERIYRKFKKLNSTNGRTLLTSLTSQKPTDTTTKRFGSTQTVARAIEGWESR
jgi:hypothetical protein